jgi:hypothetical protein
MVVDVLILLADLVKTLATVFGDHHPGVHRVDPVHVVGVGDDLLIVLAAARHVVVLLLPVHTRIQRAVEPFVLTAGLDDGVDDIGVGR